MALAVPLSRFTSRVGGGSAFFVRPLMFIWYFINVPELPYEVIDQKRAVTIERYLVREKQNVKAGTPIAVVETWWAVLQIEALYPCRIEKTLFDGFRGLQHSIGNPLALAICDPDDRPKDDVTSRVTIVKMKRLKPPKHEPVA